MKCKDCKGSGQYVGIGLNLMEDCRRCKGSGKEPKDEEFVILEYTLTVDEGNIFPIPDGECLAAGTLGVDGGLTIDTDPGSISFVGGNGIVMTDGGNSATVNNCIQSPDGEHEMVDGYDPQTLALCDANGNTYYLYPCKHCNLMAYKT